MDQLITTYRLSGYRPVLADNTENFKRFVQIKKKFEKNHLYRLFAIPKIDIGQGNAYWFTEWEGTATSLGTFSEVEKEKHLTRLKYEVDFLFEECRKYQEIDEEYKSLFSTLEKCIEIPDFSSIYIIDNPNGERHYVLTMWGFINDAFNAQSGLIRKIIPKNYQGLKINVHYPGGQIADNEKVSFEFSGYTRELTSNSEGVIILEDVLINTSVMVYQTAPGGQKTSVSNFNFTGQPEQNIIVSGFAPMRFVVKDSAGTIKPNEKFSLAIGGKAEEFVADTNGEFRIASVPLFTEVIATHIPSEGGKGSEFGFQCVKNQDPYIILLPAPGVIVEVKPTKFLLVNFRKKPIPEQEMRFEYIGKKESRITDNSGRCALESLPAKTKIKIKVRWKKRKYNKSVKCNPKIDEHRIVLGNRNLWWLLLLLLLIPLLGLIPLKKDVAVRVIDDKEETGIAGAHTELCHHERYLFDFSTGKFLSDKITCMNDSTDVAGRVVFKNVKYSVFQWLFYGWEEGLVKASSFCYHSDSITKAFDLLTKYPETTLRLKANSIDLDFLVLDASNNEPLPGAKVEIRVDGSTKVTIDSSGLDGRVVVKELPLCGNITVIGSCKGYINDSIKGAVSQILDVISKRTLKLKPITRSITFYVKNLKTKQPLPGATLQLIVDGKVVQVTQSNTNGAVSMIGEATFEKVHIIKKITVIASKIDFYDTTKVGIAQDFANGSKEQRTLYLRPKDKPCDIRIIDARTSQAISGATAILTMPNGTTKTEMSNIDGVVQFAGLTNDDIISIAASKDPDYLPNSTKISNRKVEDLFNGPQSGRDIPLSPKEPPGIPCQTVSIGDNIQGYDKTISYDMGKPSGDFVFDYFTDFQRDAIFIYCGSRLVWSYDGATKRDTPTVTLHFDTQNVKVRVKGDSRWWYKVNCPN
jgi:hypothetical protein